MKARASTTRKKRAGFDELPHGLGPTTAALATPATQDDLKHSINEFPQRHGSHQTDDGVKLPSLTESPALPLSPPSAGSSRQLRPRERKEDVSASPATTTSTIKIARGKQTAKNAGPSQNHGQPRLSLKVTKPQAIDKSTVPAEQAIKSVSAPQEPKAELGKESVDGPGLEVDTEVGEVKEEGKPVLKRRRVAKGSVPTKQGDKDDGEYISDRVDRKSRKRKAPMSEPQSRLASYGITWGQSPWPEWVRPTPEECEEVHALLTKQHGKVVQPAVPPPPSFEVAGCGEVPHILEALVRTRLSASTTMENANKAIKGLATRYSRIRKAITEEGCPNERVVYEGIDWNEVRLSSIEELEKAIRSGGLSVTKSKDIKQMLDDVHEENRARRDAFVKEQAGVAVDLVGPKNKTTDEKKLEVWLFDNGILSLDHYHGLPAEQAVNEFIRFRGIGVKTAACVALFCMGLPCFAVDVHIFRICKWLRWTPRTNKRDDAFVHLDLHVPDQLKYDLHQLLIRHGQDCLRCQEVTTKSTDGWDEENCPLEHLLDRFDKPLKEQKRAEKQKTSPKLEDVKTAEDTTDEKPAVEPVEAVVNPEFEGHMSMGEIASQVGEQDD
ncbi:Endonuclease III [Pleurostoma richardsiae]|uniref:Endonuclease III n=1 Tax=Pleurostoma richardsiae TaxID=41990 RepID=A0AA38VNL8_9PEZI|nr:Endonuclease III [Pleurostoma richardsiae]